MKKAAGFFAFVFLIALNQAIACTTFFLNKNGQLVFGGNYDWVSGAGMVCTNQRSVNKTSMKTQDGNTTTWVSKYGSITFNQYGKEFPTSGMNEAGLVVELMWADGTKYPMQDARPSLGVLQWIQFQLDNCSSIDEVIATDKLIRISAGSPPLHYLVADASGNAATIEFFDGRLIVHRGNDLPYPVLTNNPYTQSAKVASEAISSADTAFAFLGNSLQRFAKACSMVQKHKHNTVEKPVIEYAFNILDNVAQPGFTKWSLVFDVSNKKIYFKTSAFKEIKSLDFKAFNFSCSSESLALDMNRSIYGDVSKKFKPFSTELNSKIITQAIDESARQVPISDASRDALIAYPGKLICTKEHL